MSSSSSSSSSSSIVVISPRKLHSEVYSYSYQDDLQAPLVISVLASLIERTMARNRRTNNRDQQGRRILQNKDHQNLRMNKLFDCNLTPDMSVQSYLERIFKYARVGPSVYVVAYVYIDRFCHNFPGFRISASNVHRLLVTTIMVASKYVEDMNYRNSYYARVGGLEREEMNKLEMEFLFALDFKLHVNVSVFQSYCSHLEREVGIGGGFHVERTLRCAEEIKILVSQSSERISSYNTHIPRVML